MPSKLKGQKAFYVYVDEPVHRAIKVYAAETDQDMYDVIKPFTDKFVQSVLELVAQLQELKRQAETKRLQEEEAARLALENPLKVTGNPAEEVVSEIVDTQTC